MPLYSPKKSNRFTNAYMDKALELSGVGEAAHSTKRWLTEPRSYLRDIHQSEGMIGSPIQPYGKFGSISENPETQMALDKFLRNWRKQPENELPYDMPPPGGIYQGQRGERIESYNSPPPIESFLGDQYLSRWIKAKQLAIGNVKKADDDELRYIDDAIEGLEQRLERADPDFVDFESEGQLHQNLEMLRARREQFQDEIDQARLQGEYEFDTEGALDSLQSAANTAWLTERQRAFSSPPGRHMMIKNWKQDIVDAQQELGKAPNSLYARGLRDIIRKRQKAIGQEASNMNKPPWHLPPKLNDRLNRPNTIRGGD